MRTIPRAGRCAGTLLLAVLLLLPAPTPLLAAPLGDALQAPSTQTLPDEAVPAYVGLDNVHVRYTYQSSCTTCKRELQALMPDGSVHVLTTLATGQINDSFQHAGLPPGTYGYHIMETRLSDGGLVNSTPTRYAKVDGTTVGGPSVDGTTMFGTLLYDEYLSQEFGCRVGGLTVSDGVNMTLDGAHLNFDCRVLLDGSATFSAQGTTFTGDALTIDGTGNADIVSSTFPEPILLDVGSGAIVHISNSRFGGQLHISGAARSLHMARNRFADAVRLLTRSAVALEDNVFLGSLFLDDRLGAASWCQDNGLSPTITGNSFLGSTALGYSISGCAIATVRPIDVGSNYYGDPQGPVYGQTNDDPPLPGIDYSRTWLHRGASVFANPFRLATPLKTGQQWQDTEPFPRFWVNGYRLGQHTVTDRATDLLRGKESLFSIDLVTDHESVEGAKVWVMWNGQRVEPSTGATSAFRLVRDPGTSATIRRTASSTIDFFLPPAQGEAATLELWLDTRTIAGYPDAVTRGAETRLVNLSVPLRAPPPVVGIHIVPVTLDGVTASIGGMRSTLTSVTPAMLPVVPANLRISATGYSPAWNTSLMPTSVLVNLVATHLVRYRAAMRYDPDEFPTGQLMDFVVGVMPSGSLGGGDGVYMNLRRGVVLVDENKPEAVFHELGHAIGLYNVREQYSWPNYPPNGLPVEGVTLFLNQPSTSNGTVNGVFVGDSGRMLHTAAPGQWWHDEHLVVVDVMGNTAPFWPHPDTLQSFQDFFYSLAAEPRPTFHGLSEEGAFSPAAAGDLRRVVVTVDIERVEVTETSMYQGERRCAAYRPLIETARVYPRDEYAGTVGASTDAPEVTTGALPLCLAADYATYAAGDIELCLMPIGEDDDIMPEYYQCQRVLAPEEVNTARQRDVAVLFYDVPTSAARYSLVTTRNQASPRVLTSSASLGIVLLEPAAGQTLAETETLRWRSHVALRDGESALGQPLLHQVSYSADGGATWTPVGPPVEGDSLDLSTVSLPSGDGLAFRVTVSDGFRTASAQVGGLRLPRRPPEVEILGPRSGDRAAPGYAWRLQAYARDGESGAPLSGSWRSSSDEALGNGPVLDGVVLTPGTHQLTYAVTDGAGVSAQAQVTVTVGDMSSVDLAIAPDALAVSMPWRDPVVGGAPLLRTGTSQTITLALRNPGAEVTATLRLYVRPPGGAERLLAEEKLDLAPFESRRIGGEFTASAAGAHRFRGVVTVDSPTDSQPGNNEQQWDVVAASPAALSAGENTVTFSAPPGTPVDRPITLTNAGGLGLIVQQVALEEGAALSTGFRLWADGCSGAALAPGETCRVTVRYTPAAGVEEQVRLEIASTDPDRPEQDILLLGRVGELEVSPGVHLPLVMR